MSAASLPDLSDKTLGTDFEAIYRKHAPMVYRTAKSVLGNAADAEDVLQIIFVRLLRRELAPDILENLNAYLYRAAINLSLDMIETRRRHVQTDDPEQFEAVAPASNSDWEEELHQRLFEGIAQLGSQNAEMVILRYVHDMSDAEIAKMLGVSRGTVAVRLFRLRARLKQFLRGALGGKA